MRLLGTLAAIRASFRLLTPRERTRYLLAVSAQAFIAVLDLAGVVLIGLVVANAMTSSRGGASPTSSTVSSLFGGAQGFTTTELARLALIAAAALLLKSLLSMALNSHILNVLASSEASVSRRLTRAFMSQQYEAVRGLGSSEVVYALSTGVTYATLIMLSQAAIVASESVLLMLLVVGLLIMDPFLTLFALVFFFIASAVLYKWVMRRAQEIGRRSSSLEINSRRSVQEVLRVFKEVVVLNRRNYYVSDIANLRAGAAQAQAEHQFITLVPKYTLEIAFVLGVVALAGIQWITATPETAFATVAVFAVASARIVPSILRLQTALVVTKSATGLAEPTFQLLEQLAEDPEATPAVTGVMRGRTVCVGAEVSTPGDFVPSIEIRGLSVVYGDAETPSLEGVDLSIAAGTSVALVGRSGAGKTTLAYAILGLISPSQGSVEVNGVSPAEAVACWPGSISYVPQDVALVSGTVASNVALGVPPDHVDLDRVWDALDRAHLGQFLRSTGRGVGAWVGENGVNFSGGQMQRLGVARALYVQPRLVVLDEATSALDAETEELVANTVKALGGGVTIVTVAHRLATVREHDLVVYLEKGRVEAVGSFDEVRQQSANFDRQARLLGL